MNASYLEDIAPVVGYRATRIIAAWFAGRKLHVPVKAQPGHPLEVLIGRSALAALVAEFASETVWVPGHHEEDRYRRDRQIAERLAAGATTATVAAELGLTSRRVEQIRLRLVESGWLRYAQGYDTARAHARGGKPPTHLPEVILQPGTGALSG